MFLFGLKVSQSVFNLETHPIDRQISGEMLKLLVTISYFLECWRIGEHLIERGLIRLLSLGRALEWWWSLTPVTSRIITAPCISDHKGSEWPRKYLNLMSEHAQNIGLLTAVFTSPDTDLYCNTWWLPHIVFGMLRINQLVSPGGGGWCCYLIALRVHFSFLVTGADTWVLSQQSEHFPSVNGYASILNKHDSAFLFATLYK